MLPNHSWDQFFVGALPDSQEVGVLVVMHGTCQDQAMSFLVNGQGAQFLADADLHDPRFDELKRDFAFSDYLRPAGPAHADSEKLNCAYSASIYPTMDFADEYFTDFPIIYAVMVITSFVIATICFAIYDILVQRRQRKLLEAANKTNAIVSSLFPSNVRDRLLEELDNNDSHHPGTMEKIMKSKGSKNGSLADRGSLHGSFGGLGMDESQQGSFGWGVATSEAIFGSKPIADLFPSTTISKSIYTQLYAKMSQSSHSYFYRRCHLSSVCGYGWLHSLEFHPRTNCCLYTFGNW
jgi:hypothetical protein